MKLWKIGDLISPSLDSLRRAYEKLHNTALHPTNGGKGFEVYQATNKSAVIARNDIELIDAEVWVLVIEELGRSREVYVAWGTAKLYQHLINFVWERWNSHDVAQFGPTVKKELTMDIVEEWFSFYDLEFQHHLDTANIE